MMALIIAGRFLTFQKAESTARKFFSNGFTRQNVSVFFVTPPGQHAKYPIGGDHYADPAAQPSGRGALLGISGGALTGLFVGTISYMSLNRFWLVPVMSTLLGAYIGSLICSLARMRKRAPRYRQQDAYGSGVVLAAQVTEQSAQLAVCLLKENGAAEVEKVSGIWQNGQWQDFDASAMHRKTFPL
jgi:predicted lipid-binding transport protein (Tim44 family)